MGESYHNQVKYSKALDYYHTSLKMKEKVKGKGSIDTAITLNNIGNVYADRGNYPKALEFY